VIARWPVTADQSSCAGSRKRRRLQIRSLAVRVAAFFLLQPVLHGVLSLTTYSFLRKPFLDHSPPKMKESVGSFLEVSLF
jgi:hypothetical protein